MFAVVVKAGVARGLFFFHRTSFQPLQKILHFIFFSSMWAFPFMKIFSLQCSTEPQQSNSWHYPVENTGFKAVSVITVVLLKVPLCGKKGLSLVTLHLSIPHYTTVEPDS